MKIKAFLEGVHRVLDTVRESVAIYRGYNEEARRDPSEKTILALKTELAKVDAELRAARMALPPGSYRSVADGILLMKKDHLQDLNGRTVATRRKALEEAIKICHRIKVFEGGMDVGATERQRGARYVAEECERRLVELLTAGLPPGLVRVEEAPARKRCTGYYDNGHMEVPCGHTVAERCPDALAEAGRGVISR